MAKITIAGDSAVVTSSLKLEEIKAIQKHRPKALCEYDEIGEATFSICATSGAGSVNSFSMSFSGETHDENKFATITIPIPQVADAKAWVAEKVGRAIIALENMEIGLALVLDEIIDEKAMIRSKITVV